MSKTAVITEAGVVQSNTKAEVKPNTKSSGFQPGNIRTPMEFARDVWTDKQRAEHFALTHRINADGRVVKLPGYLVVCEDKATQRSRLINGTYTEEAGLLTYHPGRLAKLEKALESLGNLASPAYELSDGQRAAILAYARKQIDKMESRFNKTKATELTPVIG